MRNGILLLFSMVLMGCNMSSDTIATIGDYSITKTSVVNMLAKRHPKTKSFKDVSFDEKKTIVDEMLEKQMKIQDALDAGYKDSVEQSNRYKFYTLRLGNQAFFEKHILGEMFPEKVLRAYFEKQKEAINVAHVLIGFKGSKVSNPRSKKEALALARTVVAKAKAGNNFRVLASKYSDDPTVKKNFGEIGTFNWGQLVPAFQNAAFAMQVDQISEPVLTPFGYHVIKMLKKVPNPRWKEEDYTQQKQSLLEDMYRQNADSGRKLMDKTVKTLIDEYHYKLEDAGIVAMAEACRSLQKLGKLNPSSFNKEQKEIVLAHWDGMELTLMDVIPLYGESLSRAASLLTSEPKLGEDLSRKAKGEFVAYLAQKENLLDTPVIKKKLDSFVNSRMINLLEKYEVSDKIKFDQKEKEDYYVKHKSEFILPERMELWEITAKDEAAAKRIYKKAKARADFSKLAKKFSTDKLFAMKGGYVGFRSIQSRGDISKEAFKAGAHKLLKPFVYNKRWMVVKTGEFKQSVVRSYEDVANQVRIKLRQLKTRERRKAWKNELFSKHTYKINEAALKAL